MVVVMTIGLICTIASTATTYPHHQHRHTIATIIIIIIMTLAIILNIVIAIVSRVWDSVISADGVAGTNSSQGLALSPDSD